MPVCGLDDRRLDTRFENSGTKREHHRASHEPPKRGEPGHKQVAENFDYRRGKYRFLVADPVRNATGQYGHERLHGRPEEENDADIVSGQPETAIRLCVRGVEAGNLANTVIGKAFDHFHATADPEDIRQAAQRRHDAQLFDVLDAGSM